MCACQLHAIARHNDAVATMLPRREHIRARKHGPGPEILFGTETVCFGPTGMFYCVRHAPGRGPVLYGKGPHLSPAVAAAGFEDANLSDYTLCFL